MKYDVIIVGAGASGMMAAITAASHCLLYTSDAADE